MDKWYMDRRVKSFIVKSVVTLIIIVGCILILMPLWWMLATSLKSLAEIYEYPPTFFPKVIHWENYVEAWKSATFGRYTLNTLFLALFAVVANVLSNAFVGYGFSKMQFRGRDTLLNVVLATTIIPGFVTLIPTYIMFAKMNWVGSYLPIIIPPFFGSAFNIFLFTQFFKTIPNDFIEAAKIDGAGHFYIWSRIMLPMVKPVLATVAIISFKNSWNDFLGPLLYVDDEMMYTIQIGLQNFRGTVQTMWHWLMAGSCLVIIPPIVLFFIFQRYFIEGMNLSSGTKG